jgi:hypothetical protein
MFSCFSITTNGDHEKTPPPLTNIQPTSDMSPIYPLILTEGGIKWAINGIGKNTVSA